VYQASLGDSCFGIDAFIHQERVWICAGLLVFYLANYMGIH